ncbi:MAG: hypothetical protein KJ043_04725 [Anaerolineae bacterium]|nr:hypothetical protein [Anaerolineae bacterium]
MDDEPYNSTIQMPIRERMTLAMLICLTSGFDIEKTHALLLAEKPNQDCIGMVETGLHNRQASLDSLIKQIEGQLYDLHKKVEEHLKQI